jgi:hypothetical protein
VALTDEELNDRQRSLIEQVRAGSITEDLPDTTDQLLTLARHERLTARNDENGWHFTVPDTQEQEPEQVQESEAEPEA